MIFITNEKLSRDRHLLIWIDLSSYYRFAQTVGTCEYNNVLETSIWTQREGHS